MTVGKIFSGLFLLLLVGIFGLVRYGGRTSEQAKTALEPIGSQARLPLSKSDQVRPKADADGSTVLPERRQSLSIEIPSPAWREGLLRREYIAVAPPISPRVSPLRIESYPQRFESPSLILPRAIEPIPIVAPPIQIPRIDTTVFAEWQRTNEITREIGKTLREMKEREKLIRDITQKMHQEQQRLITQPVVPTAPRRP